MDGDKSMTFVYSENLIKCATDGLQKPSDFGYFGPEDMFETWGFCGIDKNRDSSSLDISNFECISSELLAKFPNDFRIETYNHWAVGSVTRMVCRILHHKGEISDKNITDAFKKAMKCLDDLTDYPVWNEYDYSERKFEDNVRDLHVSNAANLINQSDSNWAVDIVLKMYDNGIDWDPETETASDDDILIAAYQLKLWNQECQEQWFEWADKNKVPRPPFDLESISYWNNDQGRLFNA